MSFLDFSKILSKDKQVPRKTNIMGQPHYLAYINKEEGQLLKDLGGAGIPGPGGVPAYPPTRQSGPGANVGASSVGGGRGTVVESPGERAARIAKDMADKHDDNNDGPQLSTSAQSQIGKVRQDENGNWYAVKQIEGTNALGRDYSIDPKDNSQGPTFGRNVSKDVEEMFPDEVAAAGGSSDYTGSILDTFKDTDVDSVGYDAATGTYSTPVFRVVPGPVVTQTDIAQPGDLDLDDDISIDPVSEAAQKYVAAGLDDMSGLDLLAEETGTETGFRPTGYTFEAVEDFVKDQDKFRRISDVYGKDDYAKMLEDDSDTYNELTPEGKAAIDAGIVDLATSALDQVEEDDGPGFFRPGQGGFDVIGFDTGTGLLLEGSGALTTKMAGNFISAMEDIGGLPSLGITGVQEFGEDLRAQGEAARLEVLRKLQTEAPDTFDALNRPIMGDDGFDFEALAAKAWYSSIPTILGLSGIPFGITAALVTGGIMTGAEVGTEARDDTYNTAIEMGYSEAEAQTLSRSASTLATVFGMPIGALSNVLFSTVLPGSGPGSIATVAGNIVEEAVTEGYIEQNAAAGAVDLMLGTDKFGKAYSVDEGLVGALVGGGVTIATINNAINNAIDSPASVDGPSVTDLATASEILNSGADVSIVTDSKGNLIITDTSTGQSVNVGSDISSSGTVGIGSTETITSGDTQITTSVDANGNTTVVTTNTKTGVSETTTVPVNTSTTISSGVTEITVNATNTGATTTAVTNTDTTSTAVTDATTNVPAAVTNTTDTGTITTFTEEDDDFTTDTTLTSETESSPDDDEIPPVGEQDPEYTPGILGLSDGVRPTIAPYYQPQQTGQYSFYTPQPGVTQTVPAGPVFSDPTSYLALTASPQYGYGYIAPNAELEYLKRLAKIQGTGAEKLPSENLMDGS